MGWLRPDRRGACARLLMHLRDPGACGRARGPGLERSEVSRSPQHPFLLTHAPQLHALGVPPADEAEDTPSSPRRIIPLSFPP
ncbi:hypothetical protein VULLAG_LOCUS11862 [Vulpes lagopus]